MNVVLPIHCFCVRFCQQMTSTSPPFPCLTKNEQAKSGTSRDTPSLIAKAQTSHLGPSQTPVQLPSIFYPRVNTGYEKMSGATRRCKSPIGRHQPMKTPRHSLKNASLNRHSLTPFGSRPNRHCRTRQASTRMVPT